MKKLSLMLLSWLALYGNPDRQQLVNQIVQLQQGYRQTFLAMDRKQQETTAFIQHYNIIKQRIENMPHLEEEFKLKSIQHIEAAITEVSKMKAMLKAKKYFWAARGCRLLDFLRREMTQIEEKKNKAGDLESAVLDTYKEFFNMAQKQ